MADRINHDATRQTATRQITALGVTEAPAYGTAEWLALDPKDPRRYAATLEAAELWRRHCAVRDARAAMNAERQPLARDQPLPAWPLGWTPERLLRDPKH